MRALLATSLAALALLLAACGDEDEGLQGPEGGAGGTAVQEPADTTPPPEATAPQKLNGCEVLEQPATQTELSDRLAKLRPHVLHFVGHGGVHQATGYPGLLFGSVKTPIWWWDSDAIYTEFSGQAPQVSVRGKSRNLLTSRLRAPFKNGRR